MSTAAPPWKTQRTRAVLGEVLALWVVVLLLIRVFVGLADVLKSIWAPLEIVLAAVPILFMYAPVVLCNWRGVDSWDYPLALPAFDDREAWLGALKLNAVVIGLVAVPWFVGYHLYQTQIFGFEFEGTWPVDPIRLIGYHIFFVAIPEEFFYRGYIQSRLDELWEPRWEILGGVVGPGLLVTCVIFAFGHSIVVVQWWHFAIIFPSLVFGWMRARTGGVIAGAMFHAWCNITVSTLDALYGIQPP